MARHGGGGPPSSATWLALTLIAVAPQTPPAGYHLLAASSPFHMLFMTGAPLSRRWPGLDARRADFMARLQADPPMYVLVGRGDANGFEPLDSMSSMMRFAELRDFLRDGYTEETSLGRFVV